jgi:hypothetical protein
MEAISRGTLKKVGLDRSPPLYPLSYGRVIFQSDHPIQNCPYIISSGQQAIWLLHEYISLRR